ncbi:MAG: carboxymuconolactone decarboxylase family protein [Myxococcota bacterium]
MKVIDLAPELFEPYFAFFRPAHSHGRVPARIKELARLRIAILNGCNTCLFARYTQAAQEGLDEATISQVHRPEAERALSTREALAVRFAERMATDFRSVDAEFMSELRKSFTDAEIAELGLMIGQYLAMGRLLVVLGGHEDACEIYTPPNG